MSRSSKKGGICDVVLVELDIYYFSRNNIGIGRKNVFNRYHTFSIFAEFWPHGCFGAKVRGQCKDCILIGPSQSIAIWRVALKNPSIGVDRTDGTIIIL